MDDMSEGGGMGGMGGMGGFPAGFSFSTSGGPGMGGGMPNFAGMGNMGGGQGMRMDFDPNELFKMMFSA